MAIDNVEQSLEIVDTCKEHFPQLQLVVRARNVQHYYELRAKGVTLIQRETFESSLLSAQEVLQVLGHSAADAHTSAQHFRDHNLAQIEGMWPHHKDEERLISLAKAARVKCGLNAAWLRRQGGLWQVFQRSIYRRFRAVNIPQFVGQ